jgi:outer membrane protein TolC
MGTLAMAIVALGACQHVPPRPLSPAATAAELDGRRLDDPALAEFLATALGTPPAEWPLRTWDVRTLTLAAIYFQPSLAVARAHAELAGAAITTAGARPNPTLSIAPEYSVNPMGAVSPWVNAVHFDWVFETAGKRRRRIERATADAEAARTAVVTESWRVRRQLATTLVTLAAARRRAATLADELAASEHLVALFESRRREGAAAVADVAPLRFALLQATTDHAAAEADVAESVTHVAAALGVPARALAGLALPAGLDDDERRALLDLAPEAARRRALLERSDVRQAVAAYAASEATLALELARQYPDVHLGPSYQFDQGQNKWGLSLSVDLPILNRNEGPIAEAVAARAEAGARLLATQASAIADVEQALARRGAEGARNARLRAVLADRDANLARVRRALDAGAADRAAVVAADLERTRAVRALAESDAALAQALIDLDGVTEGPTAADAPTDAVVEAAP